MQPKIAKDVHSSAEPAASLDEMLSRLGLTREQVFITNSVKCRPPRNRTPRDDELATCKAHWLDRQVELVNPGSLCCLARRPFDRPLAGNRSSQKSMAKCARIRVAPSCSRTPGSAMRFPWAGKAMKDDVQTLRRVLRVHRT